MKTLLLLMIILLPVYVIVDHYYSKGKYEVERMNIIIIFIVLTPTLRILVEGAIGDFITFITFIGGILVNLGLLAIFFILGGLNISVKGDFDKVCQTLDEKKILGEATEKDTFYFGINRKTYTLEEGTRVSLHKGKGRTEISLSNTFHLFKVMKVRNQLLPTLIELDQRKYALTPKDIYKLVLIILALITIYFII